MGKQTSSSVRRTIRTTVGAAEETKEISQGDEEFKGDETFEEARAEEIVFDRARTEEIAARARSQKARSMSGYKTGTKNNPKEE